MRFWRHHVVGRVGVVMVFTVAELQTDCEVVGGDAAGVCGQLNVVSDLVPISEMLENVVFAHWTSSMLQQPWVDARLVIDVFARQ